jgi:hypothetical protein
MPVHDSPVRSAYRTGSRPLRSKRGRLGPAAGDSEDRGRRDYDGNGRDGEEQGDTIAAATSEKGE